jgi:hypothetical protein
MRLRDSKVYVCVDWMCCGMRDKKCLIQSDSVFDEIDLSFVLFDVVNIFKNKWFLENFKSAKITLMLIKAKLGCSPIDVASCFVVDEIFMSID